MFLTLFTSLFPLVLKLIDWWLKKNNADQEMTKSFYDFLNQIDKKGLAKVAKIIEAEKAREDLKKKIKEEREAKPQ